LPDRNSHEAGLRHGIIYAASKGMLTDRVMAMRGANIFEPHRYRHLVGPARIDRVADGVAHARTNFFAVRIMHNGDSQLFATGRYLDRIDVAQTPLRFIERLVILDSQKIDTLLVLPLWRCAVRTAAVSAPWSLCCHCERSEAISRRLCVPRGGLLRRCAPRN